MSYKPKDIKFEIVKDFMDYDLILSVGTNNNDSDIRPEDIKHPDFPIYFIDIMENTFVLTDEGENKFKNENEIITWCESIGMIHEPNPDYN